MRLTLRVLLAYLDNILEPADAATVEAKIAESETVSTLVHHIREISKRVRIPAPEVLGKGLGLDPNTVAEYLDYGLSDDAVRDFEAVCMQSDVHMAEVAACHEILSLVLVKPAEIDPNARQRMYTLLHEPTPAPLTAAPLTAEPVAVPVAAPVSAAQRAAAAPTSAPVEPRRRAEVPDYLRQPEDDGSRTFGRVALAAAILLALTFVGVGVLAFVPYEKLPGFMQPMAANLFNNGPEVAIVPENAIVIPAAGSTPTATGTATPTGTAILPAATGTASSIAGLRQPESVTPAVPVVVATGTVVAPLPPVPAGTVPAGTAPVATVAMGTAAPVTVVPQPGTTVVVTTPPVPAGTAVVGTAVVAPAVRIEPVGRVSSDPSQVILRADARGGWVRLMGPDTLMVGDRLIALPAYRPQLTLAGGRIIGLLGGTEIEIMPLAADGTPGIRIVRGRLTMLTATAPQANLILEISGRRLVVALTSAELAVEHKFHRPRGADPAAGPLPWSLTFYVKSGEVTVADEKGPSPALKSPSVWLITGTTPLEELKENLPAWISADERDLPEKLAADFVEEALRAGKAVNVALEEIVDDRRIENQQLALRCLAQLGDYNDFTALIRDPAQRQQTWDRNLDVLAAALDYGPYYAERIRDAFIKQQGPMKGVELYRLVWGFNDDQLKQGMAKLLVETLDHDDLDFRVLAFWNLVKITGTPLGYMPQDPPLKRKTTVIKWQQKHDSGQIVYKKS